MDDETVSTQVAPEPKGNAKKATVKPHTSVLYFHGMGSQRRYEEICRLVDCLDAYAHKNMATAGRIQEIKPEIELPRGSIKKDVTCIKARRVLAGKAVDARFYEVYWAPLLAGGVPSLQVLRWLLKQIPHPLSSMKTRWRLRARLRRATLIGLAENWFSVLQRHLSIDASDFSQLVKDYDEFEGLDARRAKDDNGGFRSFLAFLRSLPAKHGRTKYQVRLAKVWFVCYQAEELWHLFLLVTIALTAMLGVLAISFGIVAILKRVSGFDVLPLSLRHSKLLQPTIGNIVAILGGLATVLGINKFLADYLGDVEVWTTYEETDEKYKKREEVLAAATDMFRHVLEDPLCERLVVVAHSLGTTVAMDSLLELNRYNRARPKEEQLPLEKIDLLFTMGSPIDKVHYFFESVAGKYHRYNRVVENLRGDIGSEPFAKNGKPQIHWVNFWDRADLVSGSLKSASSRERFNLRVDNYELASYGFPVPGKSHSGYFEHRNVLRILSEGIFDGRYAYRDLPLLPKAGYDYDSQLVGRSGGSGGLLRTRLYQLLAVSLPWLVGTAVAMSFARATRALFDLEIVLGVFLLILLAGYLLGRPWRHRVPVC